MEWKIRCSGCGEAQPTSWLEGALIPLAGWYECFACFEKKEAELAALQARLEAAEAKLELWRQTWWVLDIYAFSAADEGWEQALELYNQLRTAGEIE